MNTNFNHIWDPCELILIDGACIGENIKTCLNELKIISSAFKESTALDSAVDHQGNVKRQGDSVFLNSVYTEEFALSSPIVKVIQSCIDKTKLNEYTPYSQMNFLKNVSGYNILVSGYKNGDFYLNHQDVSVITVLFWLSETHFEGGDLIFTDFNYTVPFKSNRVVIFPSYYNHEVTKIISNTEGFVRYTVTAFLLIDGVRSKL